MRKFIHKALEKLGKMDQEQIRALIVRMSEENDLLGMILESMTDGIIVTDREHRVMLYNKSAERMFPFSQDDIMEQGAVGLPCRQGDGASSSPRISAARKRSPTGSSPWTGARRASSPSAFCPWSGTGACRGTSCTSRTSRRSAPRRRGCGRAESLASLTTLAAGVAHEIKNPLGSMGIHLQLIQKKIAGKDCIEAKDIDQHLGVIGRGGGPAEPDRRGLPFRGEAHGHPAGGRGHQPRHRGAPGVRRPELDQAGVKIESNLSAALPLLRIDARYIKQALLNLIKNAVAAMPGRRHPAGGDAARRGGGAGAHLRHGQRDSRRDHGQDLRAVLHHEALRHRAGAHHRVQDREGALRGHLGHLPAGGGDDGHPRAARARRRRRSSSTTRGRPDEAHHPRGRRREEHPGRSPRGADAGRVRGAAGRGRQGGAGHGEPRRRGPSDHGPEDAAALGRGAAEERCRPSFPPSP